MCLTNCNSLWILFFILPDSSTAACARIRARSHHLLLDLRCGLLGKWWAQSTETGWRLPNKGWHARSTLIYPLHSTHKPSTALCYSAELCSASKSTGCRKQKKTKKTLNYFLNRPEIIQKDSVFTLDSLKWHLPKYSLSIQSVIE